MIHASVNPTWEWSSRSGGGRTRSGNNNGVSLRSSAGVGLAKQVFLPRSVDFSASIALKYRR